MKAANKSLCILSAVIRFAKYTSAFPFYNYPILVGNKGASLHALQPNGSSKDYDERAAAMTSLKTLRGKQREEVLETEQLIELFSDVLSSDEKNLENVVPKGSAASSILSALDYGFQTRSGGGSSGNKNSVAGEIMSSELLLEQSREYGGPPESFFSLGVKQFNRNLDAMRGEYKDEKPKELTPKQISARNMLKKLTLNTTAIWEREKKQADKTKPPSLLVQIPYNILCHFLDLVFEGGYIPARFFYLETVARMPYFSYVTCLHFYETLGFWRSPANVKRVHFAEEWNEFHHLLIMESLGGDQKWFVRFFAQHSAIAYYLVLVHLFAFSPSLSYKFSEMLEAHAVNTYSQFLEENEELLKKLPPPVSAVDYYTIGAFDPLFREYRMDSLHDSHLKETGTEKIQSLYDVFVKICDDEGEHVKSMQACLDPNKVVRSPTEEKKFLLTAAAAALIGYFATTGGLGEVDESIFEDLEGSSPILQRMSEEGFLRNFMDSLFQIFLRLL